MEICKGDAATAVRAHDENRDDENRDAPRAEVTLDAQWCINDNQDFSCVTVDMSMCGLRVISNAKPSIGENVTVFLGDLGIVSGKVARLLHNGFAVDLAEAPPEETVDLALFARSSGSNRGVEQRAYPRIAPRDRPATVRTSDGRETSAQIIDVSRAGIALEITSLARHDRVHVGGRAGTVVRTWDHGAAVEFDATIAESDFTPDTSFLR